MSLDTKLREIELPEDFIDAVSDIVLEEKLIAIKRLADWIGANHGTYIENIQLRTMALAWAVGLKSHATIAKAAKSISVSEYTLRTAISEATIRC